MDDPVALAVAGAGLIGRQHIAMIGSEPQAKLAAVVDPTAEARDLAESLGVLWFPDITALPVFIHISEPTRPY